jgi:hypothetical protein
MHESDTSLRLYCAMASATQISLEENSNDALAEERIHKLLREGFGLGGGGRHIVMRWVKTMATGDPGLARVCSWFLHLINGRTRALPTSKWQTGCPDIIPGLTARPFWGETLRENGTYLRICWCIRNSSLSTFWPH